MDIQAEKDKIDNMSHEEICRLYRFALSGHPYFVSNTPLCDYFFERFNSLGGITPEISKHIGW